MENIENQNDTNYRSRLVDRMKAKDPDWNYQDTDDPNAPNGLNQRISDSFDEYDNKLKGYEENNTRLVSMLKKNPMAAEFFNKMVASENPAEAFVQTYGAKALEYLQSPEGAQLMAAAEAEEAKKATDSEARNQEKEANLAKSFQDLKAFADEKGLSEEQANELFVNLYQHLLDADEGIYSRDFFEMAFKAGRYDDDIANARHEGEVAGRNAKINETMRQRQNATATPPALSGQGASIAETKKDEPETWGSMLRN